MIEDLPIVYVEDSLNDAELFSRALLQMSPKSRLFHFRNGSSAQEFLNSVHGKQSLEMVVVDLNLPGLRGMDLIHWIHGQEHFKAVPLVVVSGELKPEDSKQAKEMGVNLCLNKPRDYEGWIDLVYQVHDCYSVQQKA